VEAIIGVIGFSLGASLGMGAVRAVGGGLRPVARRAIRAGLAAGDAFQAAGGRARETVADLTAEARAEAAQARGTTRTRRSGREAPQKIAVATE